MDISTIIDTPPSASSDFEAQSTPAREIAVFLKELISGMTAQQWNSMMTEHYKTLRLIDEHGSWVVPRVAEIADTLLPDNLDRQQMFQFIDQIAQAADDNAYLRDFLTAARYESFAQYMAKVDEEGKTVLPDVIAYAQVLERLNRAMRQDWQILEACKEYWKGERKKANVAAHMDLFEHAKLATVEWPMSKFIDNHKAQKIPPGFMGANLPMNIIEAVLLDWVEGMWSNGLAGIVLAQYKPGKRKHNPKTAEGPSCFSDDGKAIWLNMALPHKWADLYTTWNLAFVTGYNQPYIMVKLLIPSVNNYKEAPAEYIYNRGMALYNHIHFEAFRRVDFINSGEQDVSWPDTRLRKFWGKKNARYAKQYKREVKSLW
jgi:hypothetical protein